MKKLVPILLAGMIIPAIPASPSQKSWTFEYASGSAYNFTTPLQIRQDGTYDINIDAEYATKPFHGSPYYAARIGRRTGNRGWELELIHHKLYLRNNPRNVQHFEISHGYNFLDVNRVWERWGIDFRLGGGLVITHPETMVRGMQYPTDQGMLGQGLFLSGPAGQASVGKRVFLWKGLFLSLEGKFTAAYAIIPVADGLAFVPNFAVHGLFGLGYSCRFPGKNPALKGESRE